MGTGILPPDLKTIEQLFTSDAVFTVPAFQRSYAWGTDEVEELWEDLTSTFLRTNDYFLGTVVLLKTGPATFEIIDGQQRIASLSMVFSAIRALFLATSDSRAEQVFLNFLGARGFERDALPRPKLVMNRINNDVYVDFVVPSKSLEAVNEALKSKTLHESNRLLLNAYRYFVEKVSSTTVAKEPKQFEAYIVSLIDRLRSAIKFITIPVAGAEDANLFFESLNARGKELAISDLVKNRLFYEARKDHNRAETLWQKMENQLAQKPVPEFLRHYWIAKQADETGMNIREENLYRSIAEHVKGNESQTFKLLTDFAKSAGDYSAISDYSLWPDDPAYSDDFERSLKGLRLFRVTQCNPLLLNAIQTFKTPKDVAKVFRIMANFAFRYFIIGNQSSGVLERESAKIAIRIRNGSMKSPSEVAEALLAINPDRIFRADFSVAAIPVSRARMARYLLAEVNNHLSASTSQTGAESIVDPNAKSITLEHVLPQSLGTGWTSTFSKGTDPREYVDRIGNLTLLLKKANSNIGDKSFAEKKPALAKSTLAINKQFATCTKWSDDEIEKRQAELAKAALQVWKLG